MKTCKPYVSDIIKEESESTKFEPIEKTASIIDKMIYLTDKFLVSIFMLIYFLSLAISILLFIFSILTNNKGIFLGSISLYLFSLFLKPIAIASKKIIFKEPLAILFIQIPLTLAYSGIISMSLSDKPTESKFVTEIFIVCIYITICILIKCYYCLRKPKTP